MTTMRAVMLTRRGGPEVLETVELPLPAPGPGEVRVKVLATGVGATDITMRRGSYPYAPPMPFVPGYESVGVVDAVGAGVTRLREGDRVCALLVHGGYATHVIRGEAHWVHVPQDVDPVDVAASLLNGVTAWQMIHREARLAPGQSALVNAANGGVGQVLLSLLAAHGVEVIGAAGSRHHPRLQALGATPIEGRATPLDGQVLRLKPLGVDAAFDGVGGAHTAQCVRSTRRGGVTVWYGFGGASGVPALLRSAWACFVQSRLTGRRGRFYGITMQYRRDPRPFFEDVPRLFELLRTRRFVPHIAQRLPLLAAREANVRLEAGHIEGKLVLVAEGT